MTHMDERQSVEFAVRSHALSLQLLDEAARQFEETQRLAKVSWLAPLAVPVLLVISALLAHAWFPTL
ncbi:hypothetical protein C6T59_08030 [Burkholderia multivorans]|nr:hypothetical protein C6Q01_24865 [Burkholderia multivorans]PRG22587.1 hypothetical protein C6Q35_16620 [Burkholderia multivorans]PRG68682.1 hypothetical protein C6T59_08030 [Burkholderia multivorans]